MCSYNARRLPRSKWPGKISGTGKIRSIRHFCSGEKTRCLPEGRAFIPAISARSAKKGPGERISLNEIPENRRPKNRREEQTMKKSFGKGSTLDQGKGGACRSGKTRGQGEKSMHLRRNTGSSAAVKREKGSCGKRPNGRGRKSTKSWGGKRNH